jgi:GxxExxY protein
MSQNDGKGMVVERNVKISDKNHFNTSLVKHANGTDWWLIALAIEMQKKSLSFQREMVMTIFYDGIDIGTRRVDFFVEEKVMVDLKALEKLEDVHKAQAINYCEAYCIADGLLINFGGKSLDFKRVYNKNLVNPKIK